MPQKHANRPCTHHSVRYHGGRRRQCSVCKKTWRIRAHRRGRKRKRSSSSLALRVLTRRSPSLRTLAADRGKSREAVRRDFHRSLAALTRGAAWRSIPEEVPLIAIADALRLRLWSQPFTLYLVLLRPVSSTCAVILPPYLREGEEGADWVLAMARIPEEARNRIIALVSDGHMALQGIATREGWKFQCCHFHLKMRLGNYFSRSRWSRGKVFAWLIHSTVDVLLETTSLSSFRRAFVHLFALLPLVRSRRGLVYLQGFVKGLSDYRTYLRYPELQLPTTSNVAESLNRTIREVLGKTRGFSSPTACYTWLSEHLRQKGTMICRPKLPPN